MYQVKHSTKGQMKDFDIGVYNQEAYIARTRREFHQLISEERVYYYFQPIFSAQTGRVHAYEALMRSDLPTLRSPATIMKLAREQGALYEIERLTFRKALEEFDNLRSKNLVDRQALIFINSIASVCLRREDSEYMDQRWHELRRQMVIEITEEEEMNREALETKRHAPGFSGMFALDDYGSGYSNEGSLLELAPRFIKVDISIIRGIDSDPDSSRSCATWCATPSRAACRSLPRVWKRPPRCAPSSTWGPTCCRATSWRGRPLCPTPLPRRQRRSSELSRTATAGSASEPPKRAGNSI